MYYEAMGDILRIKKGAIAHCITSDYSLGAGIAAKLESEYNIRRELANTNSFGCYRYPDCLVVFRGDLAIFNLVTKKDRWDTPSYENLEGALIMMKDDMAAHGITDIYVPQLGCGKDRLEWNKVKSLLQKLFKKDKDYNVHVLLYISATT